ncbi:sigma-70 family RNA polymerase sigma factor [Neobacillus rhizosphaerae]|uniref:sigma-70 family RNA polymerase sigma factor n=1 Tax=Neobacillus rhizosphaerae TaxID=2880965 RepID=UPI003D2A93B1
MSHKLRQDSIESSEDENGFEEAFWLEYYPKLQRYCHFLTQNKWDGEDIAQETYLKALRYSNQPQKMTSALLNKMAYNHWIDLLRKRKKETIETDSDCASHAFSHQLDALNDSVELLLKYFTPKQAVIFLLKEAFQYQLKEISDILDLTEIAVKSNLHRAKKRLEKAKEEDQLFGLESFWDREERKQLADLFYEALKDQDPTILIDAIPSLKCISTGSTIFVSSTFQKTRPNFSPSSTLCMAA